LSRLNVNERQMKALSHIKSAGRITNAEFQKLAGGSPRTALRELSALVESGVLRLVGSGRGAVYVLAVKRAMNAPNAPPDHQAAPKEKRAIIAPNAPANKPAKSPPAPTTLSAAKRGKRLTKGSRKTGGSNGS
jgi:hypothetical protein